MIVIFILKLPDTIYYTTSLKMHKMGVCADYCLGCGQPAVEHAKNPPLITRAVDGPRIHMLQVDKEALHQNGLDQV